MMYAKCLTRYCKRWSVLRPSCGEVEKTSSTCSVFKNKFYRTGKNVVFRNDDFLTGYGISRRLHTSVELRALEISHAYSVLQNSEDYAKNTDNFLGIKNDVENIDIKKLIASDWGNMNKQQMLQNFEVVSYYANKNNEFINNNKYSDLVKVLVNNCKNFDKNELLQLLKCLELWPTEAYFKMSHEMVNIVKAIEKEYINILHELDKDMIFLINDCLYKIKFLHMSQFAKTSLESLNLLKLSSNNLVQLMFFMTVHRRIQISLKELEYYLWKYYDKFTLDELGVIGMTFFKYKTKIQNINFLYQTIKKIQDNIDTIDDVTLTLLLKILRYSVQLNFLEPCSILLQTLLKKIPYLNLETITQIAHLMGNCLIHNEEIMLEILNRYEIDIGQARLKDIERLCCILYIFAYDPKTTSFYSTVVKEILNPRRANEIKFFPKSVVYTIMYMLQMNYYSEDALNYVMNPNFVKNMSNNKTTKLEREYLLIDYCIEIDHPEYKGPRLDKELLKKLKIYGVFYKDPSNAKNIQFKKMIADICYTCRDLFKSESAVHIDFLLPHITKNQIIVCYDPLKKKYVSPSKQLSKIQLGSIKYAPKDGKKWYAIVIGSHNFLTRDTANPTGMLTMQMRHLERIGYTPILIKCNDWLHLQSKLKKKQFLSSLF